MNIEISLLGTNNKQKLKRIKINTNRQVLQLIFTVLLLSILSPINSEIICPAKFIEAIQLDSNSASLSIGAYQKPGSIVTWTNPTINQKAIISITGWQTMKERVLRISVVSSNLTSVRKVATQQDTVVVESQLEKANIFYLGFKDDVSSLNIEVVSGSASTFNFSITVHEKGWIYPFYCNSGCTKTLYQLFVGNTSVPGQFDCGTNNLIIKGVIIGLLSLLFLFN